MYGHRARIDGSLRLSANVPHSGASTVARIHTGCHPADLMPCSADTGALHGSTGRALAWTTRPIVSCLALARLRRRLLSSVSSTLALIGPILG